MKAPERPPAIFSTLRAGFDTVSTHPQLLLFSISVDLFLWLGPKAQARPWLQARLNEMETLGQQMALPADLLADMTRSWGEILPRLNFWAAIRTFPVGVPGLIWARMPLTAPWSAGAFDLPNGAAILGFIVLAAVFGWLLGGAYLWAAARSADLHPPSLGFVVRQSIWLMIFWQMLLFGGILGSSFLTGVLLLFSPALAQGGVLALFLAAFWMLPLVFFSPYGIVVHGQTALASFRAAWRFIRSGQPWVNFFLFDVLLLSWISVGIWNTPADDSWLLLAGIGGHAFVSAALTVAGLRYYQDLYAWLEHIRQPQSRSQADGGSLDQQL